MALKKQLNGIKRRWSLPLVSIITPAYIDTIQRNEWLNESIGSVFKQSLTDFEIILIDDASPITITTEFEGEPRLRRIRATRRSGPALARNTGVHLALGKALLPLDADDLLADENVLAGMYEIWQQDKSKIIYGDLLINENGNTRLKKLPAYTFQRALDPTGLLPVTGMHSLECHQKAGGWKHELEAGLEDIEYWIAAGKAGCCGQKINTTTLIYRKHDTGRHHLMRIVNKREPEMKNRMRLMHEGVYEGRFPMGCCGGSQVVTPIPMPYSSSSRVTTLDQYAITDKTWVRYDGKRRGGFQVRGEFTDMRYQIEGPGHKLEVHNNDLSKFRRSGRGQDFKIGVSPPEDYVIPEPVQQIEDVAFVAEKPIVTEIERYDSVAEKALSPDTTQDNGRLNLEPLELPANIHDILQDESWTIENLALAKEEDLLPYPGIGPQWAGEIIVRAKANG